MCAGSRHEICQKFYTAGLSGQRFYTFNFTEFHKNECFWKFTPLAKILHCRRQWRQWQSSPVAGRGRISSWNSKRREFILIAPLLAHFYSMSFHNHLDCGHIGSPSPTPISSKKKVVFVTISYWRCSHMMSIEGMYTARLTIHPCDWKWASSWDRGDRVYMT